MIRRKWGFWASWVARRKYRTATHLRRLANRLDPRPEPKGIEEAVNPLQARFRVSRYFGTTRWTLYDGPSGATARDVFLHEKNSNAVDTTKLEYRAPSDNMWHVRDTYAGPPSVTG